MLLPEEIENQQFEVSFRGYNTREVDEFLNKVHSELEEMIRDQEVMRKKIAAAELLAKDAQDREEEFMESMQADREEAATTLTSAKAEGERIIREAKNAATGIMAEVRRRAGEISAESKKAATQIAQSAKQSADKIIESANAEAEETLRLAKAEADEKLYSARTEADNIVKAAEAQAKAILAEAKESSAAKIAAAESGAAECEAYIKEIRTAADSICRELDIELKNSAARISLLGKRIIAMDVAAKPASPAVEEIPEVQDEEELVVAAAEDEYEEEIEEVAETEPVIEETIAHAKPAPEVPKEKPEGGYFTKEYRQVMEELFGDDASASVPEDDDTYDYFDKVSEANAFSEAESYDEDEDISDTNEVTSEYTDFTTMGGEDLADDFSTAEIDRIFKSPSADDINDIMNEF